ncbi:Beta-glucan synthesis-associated SKN1 [Micractinium conductrix]|uniref:Beta-glucan synthesis-associated SKN1 n=1 Tax=Micractinium conductrix TaxID=554055 RepID=A0A2P6VQZ4_9CHLO|nr:Beta-glucan synthesis-associated SKN1 [Micractinium conductrix]|eukprot:PSC76523.1 Beta-glucan synthesis-associated SKN1 [Micractinium conductrix]
MPPASPVHYTQATGRKPSQLLNSPLVWLTLGAVLGALFLSAGGASFGLRGSARLPWMSGQHGEPAPRPGRHAALVQQQQQLAAAKCPKALTFPELRDKQPWEALLTDEEVQRAEGYYGSGQRIRRVAKKLLKGEAIQVFTLGGSVTRGLGASKPEFNYANRFFSLINSTFPHSSHVFSNKGIGGTSSGIFTACAEAMVPPTADLVVVEFTYNEPEDDPFDSPTRRGFEELLRKLLKLENGPAVVLLHHYAWWFTYGDGVDRGLYYRMGEAQLSVFSNYYDMPSVSMRNVLWPLMAAGVEGFKPDKVNNEGQGHVSPLDIPIPGAQPGEEEDYYYHDRTHPSDRGHKMMAEALAGPLLRAAAQESAAAAGLWALRRRDDPRLRGLPPPMIPGNTESPTTLCAMQEAFQLLVTASKGFTWRPERPTAPTFVEQKWGWTGLAVGDWAELVLDTRADGKGVRAEKDGKKVKANIWLSYLRSYTHMGVARVECRSGCKCEDTRIDSTWADHVSLQQIHMFRVSQHKRCVVRVTVVDERGAAKSDGHKVSLTAVMVTQFPIRLSVYAQQFEDVAANAEMLPNCSLRRAVLVVIGVLLAAAALPPAAAQDCRARLLEVSPGSDASVEFVDVETPSEACTKRLDGFDATYQLVYSDEFNEPSGERQLGVKNNDARWTAEDMYYFPTNDSEVYKPEQLSVQGGAAVFTMQRTGDTSEVAPTQQPDGTVWQVARPYKSGFLSGWNKFCYTGGYVEAAVQLPGNDQASGFWPAFWVMGNLGRAGYMRSTGGMWPYSYNTCEGSGKQAWSGLDGQLITACAEDPPGVDRTAWGLHPGQGRGSPEFDVFEIANSAGGAEPAHASQTLQMAPLMPEGVNWWDGPASGGVQYPGSDTEPFWTHRNPWRGKLKRPGNEYQDSISAVSDLTADFFNGMRTWGVDWRPGEYLRWYIDGKLVYEVNQQALVAQTNGTGASVGPRLIPLEPMYLIFNLGMSENFGKIEYDRLPFPAQMKVDWVRVYQDPAQINVGCSPPGFPTAQFLACNRDRYLIRSEEQRLIKDPCISGVSLPSSSAARAARGRRAALPGAAGAAAAAAALVLALLL